MQDLQMILADSNVQQFSATHQGAAEEISRAASELANADDAIRAMKKLLPALGQKVVPVFFSYKKKDERAAQRIVEVLRTNSADKLQITYQGDFTREIAGRKWREKIRASIEQANWFVLLLPDHSDDWDWCLFETGIFEAQRTSADRLICLHHPDTRVPDQIEGYHAVSATIPEVEEFLKMVYVNENPIPGMKAINKSIERQIPDLARQIVEAIRPPKRPYVPQVFEPSLELKFEDAKSIENRDDLDAAVIASANKEALDLFEFRDAPETWGELRSGLPESKEDGRWREELFHVIRRIAQGRKFHPIQAVFQTKTGKMYRPVAFAIYRLGDERGPIDRFQITFTEDVAAVDHSQMPGNLSGLATVLRFAFRFRWEVLEKFTKGVMAESDVERLDSALTRMQVEWQSRGAGNRAAIEYFFPEGKARDRIAQMSKDWAEIRNTAGTGELDVAIEHKDTQKIQEILKRIIPMNQEFLETATSLFSELIHDRS
jgi:TIR domain